MKTFELIRGQIVPEKIRILGLINDDELLRDMFTYFICEAAGYLKVPTKSHKVEVARKLISMGLEDKKVKELLGISQKTIFRIKNGQE